MNKIQLIRITDTCADTWDKAMEIYDVSFPPEEKRPYQQHVKLMQENDAYHFYAAMDGQILIGIVIMWKMQGFIYLDYLATLPGSRNKGYGKMIVEQLKQGCNESIIIEVELPEDDLSNRRIGFYTRLGFHLLDFPYYMPKYDNPKEKFPMLLMSFPDIIDGATCRHVMSEIHTKAYNSDL